VDFLDLGDLLDHATLDRLDRHRGDTASAAGAAELDGDLAGLAVEVLDGGAAAVHLDLREVPTQEVRDSIFQVVTVLLGVSAHEYGLGTSLLEPFVPRVRVRSPVFAAVSYSNPNSLRISVSSSST
jgi:hypothetical protein